MKKLIVPFVITLLSFWQSGYGQAKANGFTINTSHKKHRDTLGFTARLHPDFFLLGTFSDYMGRFRYVDRTTQVDRYYANESTLAEYISGYINTNYPVKVKPEFGKQGNSEIFSTEIAEKFQQYYTTEGYLKDGILDTEEKAYSFLTGVLLRNGQLLFDNVFRIQVYNSARHKEIYTLLKDLQCDKIIYKKLRNNIPVSDIFYFEATPQVIAYYNLIKKENTVLREAVEKSMYSRLNNDTESSRKAKQQLAERKKEEEESIRFMFGG